MAAVAGIRSATATLGAATEDVVTMTGPKASNAELVHHGDATEVIYFRTDGGTAAVAADESQVLLAGERLSFRLSRSNVVSVISAGIPTYTVQLLGA